MQKSNFKKEGLSIQNKNKNCNVRTQKSDQILRGCFEVQNTTLFWFDLAILKIVHTTTSQSNGICHKLKKFNDSLKCGTLIYFFNGLNSSKCLGLKCTHLKSVKNYLVELATCFFCHCKCLCMAFQPLFYQFLKRKNLFISNWWFKK